MRQLQRDEILGIVVPIMVHWVYSGMYELFATMESFKNYRLHTKDEDVKNLIPKYVVIRQVILQQMVQAVVAFILYTVFEDTEEITTNVQASVIVILRQFFVAMAVLDTHLYFMHRILHMNKFLYRHVHSWHHQIIVPYAFGSQYNHPLEGFLSDMIGGAVAYMASGMSPRTSVFFFSFATIKNIDDHSGILLPWNPFHLLLWNNTAYHDVHHQYYGQKYNFSQPFFVTWDRIFGTYMPYTIEKRVEGGFEAKPAKGSEAKQATN